MDQAHAKYDGVRSEFGNREFVQDDLAVEAPLQVRLNGKPFTVVMRTPGMEEDQIRGLLYVEDVYRGKNNLNLSSLVSNKLGQIISASIELPENELGEGYNSGRSLLSVASCGICGKQKLEDIQIRGKQLKSTFQVDADQLYSMFQKMEEFQANFKSTGGCHAAAMFTSSGTLLTLAEDIGRHNAVDKVIGWLLNQDKLRDAKCLLVSGRVSYEIITKAFAAKVPVLAAVSAPSSMAVDYAKELGITLFGFTRSGRTTCYSHPYRLKTTSTNRNKLTA